MILGSHNSLSYLEPKHWWMRPFAFMARCQEVSIEEQYEKYGVRCFDIRIRFNKDGELQVAHGSCVYDVNESDLFAVFSYLNIKKDCYVRILHEARNKRQYTDKSKGLFVIFCEFVQKFFKHIKFWCGRNLYNWEVDFKFDGIEPSCKELYASVCFPKIIDDWYPKWYAKRSNHANLQNNYKEDILLVDFVNIK